MLRGYRLTDPTDKYPGGLHRLLTLKREWRDDGANINELAILAHLKRDTVSKALRRSGPVDKLVLERLFHALDNAMQPEDYEPFPDEKRKPRSEFPPLKSLDYLPTNLPRQASSFIGRETERDEVKQRLAVHSLVTLTGTGGCGKTRLALQVAAEVLELYPQGVWFVEFAALSDPGLIVQTVATALGLRETPGQPMQQALIDYLKDRTLLLVLDNCEHLIEACAGLAEKLLQSCPNLTILVTSREGLCIQGESIYLVPFLLLPNLSNLALEGKELLAYISKYDAVRLFVERASQRVSAITLTEENAAMVARICHRLDGIPLAIELAAAWVDTLSPQSINERLDHRLDLLTRGNRTAIPRQKSLQATLDWSYDLLTGPEQVLLRRLCVFSGGWTLAAAEVICTGHGIEQAAVLSLSAYLVAKSLVTAEEPGTEKRYRLLETIREYSQEKLIEAGEDEALPQRHQDYFLHLAEETEREIVGLKAGHYLASLETELDNLRNALEWCLADSGRAEAGLRLAGALCRFWYIRGYWSEGRRWLAGTLEHGKSLPGTTRSKALAGAANLALSQGELMVAYSLLEESLEIWRSVEDSPAAQQSRASTLLSMGVIAHAQGGTQKAHVLFEESLANYQKAGDPVGSANVFIWLGHLARERQDYAEARIRYEASLAIYREHGIKAHIADALHSLGLAAQEVGDFVAAGSYYEENRTIREELGDKSGLALTLMNLGNIARHTSEYDKALDFHKQALAIQEELGDRWGIACSLCNIGLDLALQGYYPDAKTHLQDSLRGYLTFADQRVIPECLEGLACVAIGQKQTIRAARLLGISHKLRETLQVPLPREQQSEYEQLVAAVRAALPEQFTEAWKLGAAMTVEEAVEYGLETQVT